MASIKKLPNGKWRARADKDRVTRYEPTRHFDTRKEAQRWLDEITASKVSGTYADPRSGRITFKDYAEHWRKTRLHSGSTAANVDQHLRVHCYPELGDLQMSEIRKSQLTTWLAARPIADSTKNIVLGTVKSLFADAVEDKVLATSPAKDVALPSRASTQDMWIPTWPQVNQLRNLLPEKYKLAVDLVVGAGLRQGELLGLELDCVDFLKTKSVIVRQQRKQIPSPLHIGFPKTVHSRRSIPVADLLLQQVAEHVRQGYVRDCTVLDRTQPKAKRGASDEELMRPARLLFTTGRGEPRLMWANEWRAVWRKAAEQVEGWPLDGYRGGVHCLRHFYASGLIRYGESAPTVCRRLGHANPNVTMGIYAHLWPDSDVTTRKAIEAMYAEQERELSAVENLSD